MNLNLGLVALKKEKVQEFVQDSEQEENNAIPFPKEIRHPKLKPDHATMIVELFNGEKKMAIHITQESLHELIDAFYSRSR